MNKKRTVQSASCNLRVFIRVVVFFTSVLIALIVEGREPKDRVACELTNRVHKVTSPFVFTVTNTDDIGTGSLRQAITDANVAGGTITFNIPGAGVHTISPLSVLPTITNAVVIDGYTQPGS